MASFFRNLIVPFKRQNADQPPTIVEVALAVAEERVDCGDAIVDVRLGRVVYGGTLAEVPSAVVVASYGT